MENTDAQFEATRKKIDDIDDEIVQLLGQRQILSAAEMIIKMLTPTSSDEAVWQLIQAVRVRFPTTADKILQIVLENIGSGVKELRHQKTHAQPSERSPV